MPTLLHHYIKIPTALRTWFPGGASTNWRDIIFNDATAGGTQLVIERIPANARGVRAAVYGDQFSYEAGRDRDRRDTLLLTRIEAGRRKPPRSMPLRFDRAMTLWPGGDPPELDALDELFGSAERRFADDEPTPPDDTTEPSPLLLGLLARAPSETRARFMPGAGGQEPEDANDFVQAFRRVWSRFRLDRYIDATARQETLLKGIVTPHGLSRRERDEMGMDNGTVHADRECPGTAGRPHRGPSVF